MDSRPALRASRNDIVDVPLAECDDRGISLPDLKS
jgi:hypothetical protein